MRIAWIVGLLFLAASAAHAHPYLAEPQVGIGDARSLPWNGETDFGLVEDYDVENRLVVDTLVRLTRPKPPLVRFETLRRAALYLSTRSVTPDVALPVRLKLGRRLQARAADTRLLPRARALARFDAGCFEALCGKDRTLSSGRDGYAQAKRALDALPEAAAEVEYVLARIAPSGQAGDAHAGAAFRGAKDDTLLARAILRDWQHEYPSLQVMRAELDRQAARTEPEPGFPTPPPVPGADPELSLIHI